MKLVISYVKKASVFIEDLNKLEEIWKWLLIYIWISKQDCEDKNIDKKIQKIVKKIPNLRLITDPKTWKIAFSVKDINWEILLISNFTLYGTNKKWNKIDFSHSWEFFISEKIYNKFISLLKEEIKVKTWKFGAKMKVYSENIWPLNYVLEFK